MNNVEFPFNGFEGKTILITGAGGYIAGRLIDFLSYSDCKIIAVTNKKIVQKNNISQVHGDIFHKEFWCEILHAVDVVVHLAGNTSLKIAELDPLNSLQSTVFPLLRLIEASRLIRRSLKVIFTSTATVYGQGNLLPHSENNPTYPITIYDLHKYFAEQQLILASNRGDIEAVCLRLSNVYGPSDNVSTRNDRGVLTKIALNALNGSPIKLYGGGEYLRDYIYIDDVVKAFSMVAISNKSLPRVMNLSSGESYKVSDIFKLIATSAEKITGKRVKIDVVDWPSETSRIELRNYVADISLIKSELGWEPQVSINNGIDRLLKNFLNIEIPHYEQ